MIKRYIASIKSRGRESRGVSGVPNPLINVIVWQFLHTYATERQRDWEGEAENTEKCHPLYFLSNNRRVAERVGEMGAQITVEDSTKGGAAAGVAPPRLPPSSPKSQKRCVLLRGPIYNQAKGAREEGAEHFIIKRRAASAAATAVAL